MSMMRLAEIRPDLAKTETRTVVLEIDPAAATPGLVPPGVYLFDEWYCIEQGCDCRRVLIQVYSESAMMLATIGHSFEPPSRDQFLRKQTILDPLFWQSRWASDLMDLFLYTLRIDPAYAERLVRHYEAVKAAIGERGFNGLDASGKTGVPDDRKMARARRWERQRRRGKRR